MFLRIAAPAWLIVPQTRSEIFLFLWLKSNERRPKCKATRIEEIPCHPQGINSSKLLDDPGNFFSRGAEIRFFRLSFQQFSKSSETCGRD
jgi:hypothetical protein